MRKNKNSINLTNAEFNAMMERISALESQIASSQSKKNESANKRGWDSKKIAVKENGSSVSYEWENGDYIFDKGVRKYLNGTIKSEGGVWNKDARKWVFPSKKAASAFAKKFNGFLVESVNVDTYVQAELAKKRK